MIIKSRINDKIENSYYTINMQLQKISDKTKMQ